MKGTGISGLGRCHSQLSLGAVYVIMRHPKRVSEGDYNALTTHGKVYNEGRHMFMIPELLLLM